MTAAPGSGIPLVLADSVLPPILADDTERCGVDDDGLLFDLLHHFSPHT